MMRIYLITATPGLPVHEVISVETKNNWDLLTPSHFLHFNEIVFDLFSQISKEDRMWIQSMPKEKLISLHHNVGQWIRNTYGLWHPKNPMPIPNDLGDGHPDGISMLVIEEFHRRLNNPADTAYVDAMSILTQEK